MRCLSSANDTYKTVKKAFKLGINHIETARGYGKSEEYLGLAIERGLSLPREQFYLTTKFTPTADKFQLANWIEESLNRLKTDYLDCVAIHGINTFEHLLSFEQAIASLEQAKKAGKIRHLGFSSHGNLDLILTVINTNLFSFVNLHYYYFQQRNSPAIQLAIDKDLGIFIISPSDKGGRLYTPPKKLTSLSSPFSPLHLNYRFLLANPNITTLSIGPSIPEELDYPLEIADCDYPLTETEKSVFKNLETELKSIANPCLQCNECLPCPENINIPEILRLRNLTLAYNMDEYGKYRYQMLENAAHWFPGNKGNRCTDCGECLPRCPEKLPIPELLSQTHQLLNGSPRRRLWE
jgi:predicted aldo/keto reductase-like oxidoreductase